ncbi:MAG: hypothetical protein ACLP3C_29690 [Mycobacterium sp.]|uniref:hypothetical protein n=1 Tax=Mycobacterium sp. TaxID=1785 RepID=UPI003F9CAEF0
MIHNKIHWCPEEPQDPQPSPQTSLRGHLKLVAQVEQAGLRPPDAWQAIKAGLDTYQDILANRPLLADLSAEVIGNGPNIAERAGMSATETLENRLGDAEIVLANVHGALTSAYAPIAERHYKTLASRFDAAGKRFAQIADTVDPEATADMVLSDRRRKLEAWEQAPAVSAELDGLLPALSAAAMLVRRIDQPCRLGSDPATFEIPLTVDCEGAHPRAVWLAWHEQVERPAPSGEGMLSVTGLTAPSVEHVAHRCSRWSGLLALGCGVSAHPRPQQLEMFGRPANRKIAVADPVTGRSIKPRIVDPEDGQTRPSRWARLVGTLAGRHTPDQPVDILATVLGTDQEEPQS